MDVWEHAFMRDYKATERTQYIEAFFRNIDWATVERRLQETGVVHPAGRGAGTAPVRGGGQALPPKGHGPRSDADEARAESALS